MHWFTRWKEGLLPAWRNVVQRARLLRQSVCSLPAAIRRAGPRLRLRLPAGGRLRRPRLPRLESLKLKLTLGMLGLALAILGSTYWTLAASARDAARRQAQERAVELLDLFSSLLSEPVAAKDRMQVHLLARALVKDVDCILSVTDRDGGDLFSPRNDFDERWEVNRATDLVAGKQYILGTRQLGDQTFLHTAKAIRFGATPVGAIQLWINQTALEARARLASSFVYPIFAVGLVLMLLLGVGAIHTTFRTLKRLGDEARRIGAGDLSVRVPVHGNDEVARFCAAFNAMVDGLCRAREDLDRKHLETIQAMISVVEAKDSYTKGHCLRVQAYARGILERIGALTGEMRSRVEVAALLHDIGKIGIPDTVLGKQGGLTPDELEIVRTHVVIGETILRHMDSLKEVARWVRSHHERWDGFGYPDGLIGKAIPFPSRVISVADTLDAMLTDRPYRKALTVDDAVRALAEGKGTQFDPQIVDHAIALLKERGAERVERVLRDNPVVA